MGKRSRVHESQWFPDECRSIERSFKKLDLQILGWDDECQHAAIRNDDQEKYEGESDMVFGKTFEVIEMKDLPPMQHPNRDNRIFMVRPCYLKLFDLITEEARLCENANIIVTGNPGIGKSRFYLYFLWKIIKEGLPEGYSHLVINCRDVYHFYENKEFIELVSQQERNRLKDSAGVLRLVDGCSSTLEGWHGTSVLFATPGTPRLHQFEKAMEGSTFVMPPWGLEELLICNEACGIGLSTEEIRSRVSFFGGIPRFVLADDRNMEEELRSGVEMAISSIEGRRILNFVFASTDVRQHVLKMVPLDEDTFKRESLDFLSEHIAEKVIDQIERKFHGDLESFFLETQDYSYFSLFRRRIFEKLCHRRLTSTGQTIAARTLLENVEGSLSITFQATSWTWFDEIEEITLVSNTAAYFRPTSKTFPSIDAIYWNGENLYLLQMTLNTKHQSSM